MRNGNPARGEWPLRGVHGVFELSKLHKQEKDSPTEICDLI